MKINELKIGDTVKFKHKFPWGRETTGEGEILFIKEKSIKLDIHPGYMSIDKESIISKIITETKEIPIEKPLNISKEVLITVVTSSYGKDLRTKICGRFHNDFRGNFILDGVENSELVGIDLDKTYILTLKEKE